MISSNPQRWPARMTFELRHHILLANHHGATSVRHHSLTSFGILLEDFLSSKVIHAGQLCRLEENGQTDRLSYYLDLSGQWHKKPKTEIRGEMVNIKSKFICLVTMQKIFISTIFLNLCDSAMYRMHCPISHNHDQSVLNHKVQLWQQTNNRQNKNNTPKFWNWEHSLTLAVTTWPIMMRWGSYASVWWMFAPKWRKCHFHSP